ncbi:MAG: SDR family NAD(P)-dependent oxidoreductase, partial [Chloroflexota bacterium]
VRTFAGEFVARELAPLQAIICNAGITLTEMQSTADGVDKTFQVNHLGHFLLVNLLLEHLQQPGRVVMVSSGTHIPSHKLARATGVTVPKYVNASALAHPEQASPQAKITNPAQAYSTSKLCNLLFAYELSRRLHEQNVDINTYALDPGLMPDTSFAREFPAPVRSMFQSVFIGLEPLIAGVRRGGESGKHLARLVTDPVLDDVTAAYFDGLEQVRSSADSYDEAKARDLWATSAELAQLQPHESILMKVAAV